MSLAIPLYFIRDVRNQLDTAKWRIATALVGATFISWGVCVISGMTNPRLRLSDTHAAFARWQAGFGLPP